jgi:hypothetical protein
MRLCEECGLHAREAAKPPCGGDDALDEQAFGFGSGAEFLDQRRLKLIVFGLAFSTDRRSVCWSCHAASRSNGCDSCLWGPVESWALAWLARICWGDAMTGFSWLSEMKKGRLPMV